MGKTVENASAHPRSASMRPIAASDSAQMPCHGLLHWRGGAPLRKTVNSWLSRRRTSHAGTLFMTALLPHERRGTSLPNADHAETSWPFCFASTSTARLTSLIAHLRWPGAT